jgi:hypothetical protein
MHNKTNVYPSVIDVVVDSKLPYFKKSIETLKKQTVTDFEFIIVIGHPGAETNAYLDTQDFPFKVIRIQEPPRDAYPARAAANNLGLDAATGTIYIGTQDDILYPENWIESHIRWHMYSTRPLFVYNHICKLNTDGTEDAEDELWESFSDTAVTPLTSRWKYASGHSFSLPMVIAKSIRHNEEFCGNWGFEDLAWSFEAHMAGCRFIIDNDVRIVHLEHDSGMSSINTCSKDEFYDWLRQRSTNRALFASIYGHDPEYDILEDGF